MSAPLGVMPAEPAHNRPISPTRLLEMLSDRFGAFEAIANSSIKLALPLLGELLLSCVFVLPATL